MHHQTAKAVYRALTEAADTVEERGFTREPSNDDRCTLEELIQDATRTRSPLTYHEVGAALQAEVGVDLETYAAQARNKRQVAGALRRAARTFAETNNVNLTKV